MDTDSNTVKVFDSIKILKINQIRVAFPQLLPSFIRQGSVMSRETIASISDRKDLTRGFKYFKNKQNKS